MAWRVVKQPNGLFARFSDIVDHFTDFNLTEEEAGIEVCREYLGRQESIEKVQRAIVDDVFNTPVGDVSPDGLRRWREALRTIELCHGKDGLEKFLSLVEGKAVEL